MSYTEQDVERADEAYQRAFDAADRTGPAEGRFQRSHLAGLRAALEAMAREPLVHGDLLDRLTRVAEVGFHWWEAWADEGGYDGEYKHMDREQRIDHILCHDLLLALDALAPDYFDGLTGKPKYAVAAAKEGE